MKYVRLRASETKQAVGIDNFACKERDTFSGAVGREVSNLHERLSVPTPVSVQRRFTRSRLDIGVVEWLNSRFYGKYPSLM